MPCYEPPPDFAGEEKDNAVEAVKILCDSVSISIQHGIKIAPRILFWAKKHYEIDIKSARFFGNKADVERATENLAKVITAISEIDA